MQDNPLGMTNIEIIRNSLIILLNFYGFCNIQLDWEKLSL